MPRSLTTVAVFMLAAAALMVMPPLGHRLSPANAAEGATMNPPLGVIAAPVKRLSGYEVRGRYVGRVVGRRSSALGFDTSGLLDAVLVREGDRVRRGDVLARLNITRLTARRRQLVAELAVAHATHKETEANLALAKTTATRQNSLLRSDNVSRQAYDEARFRELALQATLEADNAAIDQADAAISSLDADIALSQIVAPFDGTVVRRLVDEGVALGSATPVLRLLEDEAMEVRIGLPPAVAEMVATGRTYAIAIAGRVHTCTLRAVLDALDPVTRTVPAIFVIDDRPAAGALRSGQLAFVEIAGYVADEGFWVPLGALVGGRRGLWDAMALVRVDGETPLYRTIRREVEVLQTETERVFVRGAIADGDLIVTGGLHRVVPGQIVRLADPRP